MSNMRYVRTDKNGTKIYHDYTCQRCGGVGGCDKWAYTGWTCYECGGTGEARKPEVIKVYTPEYRAKLDAMNAKRAEKKRAKRTEEFKANLSEHIQKKGFNKSGKIYVSTGNTYEIKDQLREAGAKWNSYPLGSWVFTEKPEEFNTVELTADECLAFHYEEGWLDWSTEVNFRELINSKMPTEENTSQYVGNVGDRLDLEVTFIKRFTYEIPSFRGWGTDYMAINTFKDDEGNCFIWKSTRAYFNVAEGSKVRLRGTVKEHSEYKGTKQTMLQRCKVEEL